MRVGNTYWNSRRKFIKRSIGLSLILPVFGRYKPVFQEENYPKILFRFGWDKNNNDDIAFIPALYRLSMTTIQKTEFYLWLHEDSPEILEMLNSNFTNLKIVKGDIDEAGVPTTDELRDLLSETDLLIYTPGAAQQVDWAGEKKSGTETRSLQYCAEHSIPFAILGLGSIPVNQSHIDRFLQLTGEAEFVFSTSSEIDETLKEKNIKIQKLKQLPNPLFAFDLRNANLSRDILEERNLFGKDYLCIDFRTSGLSDEKISAYVDKISTMIRIWIEETGKHVLLLPNDIRDIDIMRNGIFQPLPAKLKSKVVFIQEKLRPDVAASLYEKSRIVSGMSLFPACAGIQVGIPVCFLSTADLSERAETIKDMGLKNSIQDLESSTGQSLAEILLEINGDYVSGIVESDKASEYAIKKLTDEFVVINKFINKTAGIPDDSKKQKKKNKT